MTVFIIIILILAVWVVFSYNKLVRDKNRVEAGWSDIDVQLRRRHDLIPNLVKTTKQYAAYEQSVLSVITELRSESMQMEDLSGRNFTRKADVENKLAACLFKVQALVEDYPDLKADQSFLELQQQLVEVEEHLQFARRYYNGAVRNLNTRVESFPDLIVARAFGFIQAEFFQLEAERMAQPPSVSFDS